MSDRNKPCLDLDFSGHSVKQITNPCLFLEDGENIFICCLEEWGWICLGVIRGQRRANSYKGKKKIFFFFFLIKMPWASGNCLLDTNRLRTWGPTCGMVAVWAWNSARMMVAGYGVGTRARSPVGNLQWVGDPVQWGRGLGGWQRKRTLRWAASIPKACMSH